MTRISVPFTVQDFGAFTHELSLQLGEQSPSHLSLMNMVARAAGFQNAHDLRGANVAADRLERWLQGPVTDARMVERTLHQFDSAGQLLRWPAKRAVQTLALWALWAVLPADVALGEREINNILEAEHLFGDTAILRRTMITFGMLTRRPDGTEYRRIEKEPPAEAKALIRVLTARRRSRSTML